MQLSVGRYALHKSLVLLAIGAFKHVLSVQPVAPLAVQVIINALQES
jgi:hypothetical protein